jgi:hypothetical protein
VSASLDRLVARVYHAAIDYCLDHSKNPEEFVDCLMEYREMGLPEVIRTLNIQTRLLDGLSNEEVAVLNERFVARIDDAIGILDIVIEECDKYCERECEGERAFFFRCMDMCMLECIRRRLR